MIENERKDKFRSLCKFCREDACRPCECDATGSEHNDCIPDDQSAANGLVGSLGLRPPRTIPFKSVLLFSKRKPQFLRTSFL